MGGFLQVLTWLYVLNCLSLQLLSVPVNDSKEVHTSHLDPLSNLGHISLKMVEHIAKASDEEVDIGELGKFVTALSEAAAIVKNPEVCKIYYRILSHIYISKRRVNARYCL